MTAPLPPFGMLARVFKVHVLEGEHREQLVLRATWSTLACDAERPEHNDGATVGCMLGT